MHSSYKFLYESKKNEKPVNKNCIIYIYIHFTRQDPQVIALKILFDLFIRTEIDEISLSIC